MYVTDSQALARLWSSGRVLAIPFIARQLHCISSTITCDLCTVFWVPRTAPFLRNVDALGR
jgi:hypothetical protein